MAGQSPVEIIVDTVAWLLLGAALIGLVAQWVRVPYTVALVLAGLLVGSSHFAELPSLEPGLVLFAFLPPLLFDASFRLDARELRRLWRSVLALSVPGTIATALIVGGVLALLLQMPVAVALLFGSLVAATDPVAVVGVFRQLHAPHRLEVIAEGESLVNDGVAITLYTVLLGFATTGAADMGGALVLFGREALGGVLIGGALGVAFSRLTGAIDDHLVEMTLSTALAYGSYLLAQTAETSGALACVAAGLVHGSYGRRVGMTERSQRLLDDLWEYLGFLANGLVFLLVGLSVDLPSLAAYAWPIGAAVIGVVLSRVLVLGLPSLVLPGRVFATTGRERVVLVWAGLRGALTIALALALPAATPGRDLVIAMAFGVVLFTLLAQALTLPLILRRLGLAGST